MKLSTLRYLVMLAGEYIDEWLAAWDEKHPVLTECTNDIMCPNYQHEPDCMAYTTNIYKYSKSLKIRKLAR